MLNLVTALEDRVACWGPQRPGSPALPVQPPWLQGCVPVGGHVPTKRLDQFFVRLSPRTRPPPWGTRALPGSQGHRPASFQGPTHHLQDAWAPQPQVSRAKWVATVLTLSWPSCTTSQTVMEGKVVTGTSPVSVRKHCPSPRLPLGAGSCRVYRIPRLTKAGRRVFDEVTGSTRNF